MPDGDGPRRSVAGHGPMMSSIRVGAARPPAMAPFAMRYRSRGSSRFPRTLAGAAGAQSALRSDARDSARKGCAWSPRWGGGVRGPKGHRVRAGPQPAWHVGAVCAGRAHGDSGGLGRARCRLAHHLSHPTQSVCWGGRSHFHRPTFEGCTQTDSCDPPFPAQRTPAPCNPPRWGGGRHFDKKSIGNTRC